MGTTADSSLILFSFGLGALLALFCVAMRATRPMQPQVVIQVQPPCDGGLALLPALLFVAALALLGIAVCPAF